MFSLFVSHLAEEKSHGPFELERNRFLESTNENIKNVLRGLSREAIECLCSWPCILMQEGKTGEVARIVQIRSVSATADDVTATFEPLSEPIELTNATLWKLRNEFDIGQYEFSRNHWAVKDRDLFVGLTAAKLPFASDAINRFATKALPVVARAELLAARAPIAALSHGDIDDLLTEAGIAALQAGREVGGRLDRARAIFQFAIDHPEAMTAENFLFAQFLLRKAKEAATARAPAPLAAPSAHEANARPPPPAPSSTAETRNPSPNRVFVVHGRNEEARLAVVSFLESVGLRAIVLHEQPNMGRHLLTKFVQEAELVTFAVVVMTADDEGRAKDGTLAPRARQNVILELGYFLAHLSQPMVCALITPGLETPSDFDGIVYIKMAADRKWEAELFRELAAAHMPVTTKTVPKR